MFIDYRSLTSDQVACLNELRTSASNEAVLHKTMDMVNELVNVLSGARSTHVQWQFKSSFDTHAQLPPAIVTTKPRLIVFVESELNSQSTRFRVVHKLTSVVHALNNPITAFYTEDRQVGLLDCDPLVSRLLMWFEFDQSVDLPSVTRFVTRKH